MTFTGLVASGGKPDHWSSLFLVAKKKSSLSFPLLPHGGRYQGGESRGKRANRLKDPSVFFCDLNGVDHSGLLVGTVMQPLHFGQRQQTAYPGMIAVGDDVAFGINQCKKLQIRILGKMIDDSLNMEVPGVVVPVVFAQIVDIGSPGAGIQDPHQSGGLLQQGAGHQTLFQPEIMKGKGDHDHDQQSRSRRQQPGGGKNINRTGDVSQLQHHIF
jgi:hypothetical protein